MDEKLTDVIKRIGDEFSGQVAADSRFYLEVDIGKRAAVYGYPELEETYLDIYAIVPLKRPVSGMKVRIDGRTFVKYAQLDSGIVVPPYVATEINLSYTTFIPNNSMILNFA